MSNDDVVRIRLAVDEATVTAVQNRIRNVVNTLNNNAILNIRFNSNIEDFHNQLIQIQNRISQLQNAPININTLLTTEQQQYRLETQRLAVSQRLALARERTLQSENNAVSALARENTTLNQNLNVTHQINGQIQHTHEHIRNAANQANNLTTYLENGLRAFVGYRIINGIYSALSEAYEELKKVDTEMVNIRKVTGATADEMERLANSSYDVAVNYGRSASQYLSSVASFSKAGYQSTSKDLGELALLAMNVGDINDELATQFLISADAAWKYGGDIKSLRAILDGFNELSNRTATTIEELAEGITVAGSVFAQAGLSAQDYASILGTVQAKSQENGEVVARGLRTVLMNIRQIKGTNLETGDIIDESSLAKAETTLKSIGVNIRETVDGISELRNPMTVIAELAETWGTLNSVQKSALQEALAGKRQSNIFTILMENFADVEKAANIYADSIGSSLKENAYYLDSWAAKTEILNAKWTSYIHNLQDTETIKGFLDLLSGIVDVLDTDLGRVITQIILLHTTLNLLNRGFTWIQSLQAFQRLNLSAEILRITAAEMGLETAARTLTATLWKQTSAWLATPIGQLTAILAASTLIVKTYDNTLSKAYNTAQENIKQLDEQINKYNSEISTLEELQSKLVQSKGDKSALASIQSELNKQIGETPGLINGETTAYDTANNKIRARITLLNELKQEEQKRKIENSKEAFSSNFVEVFGINESGSDIRKRVKKYNTLKNSGDNFALFGAENALEYINSTRTPIHQITAKEWEAYWNEQIEIAKDVFADTINSYNGVGGAEFINLILEDAVKSGNDLQGIDNILNSVVNNTRLQDSINKYWESLSTDSDSESTLQIISNQLDELKVKYPEITDSVNKFYEILEKGKDNKTFISSEVDIDNITHSLTDLEKVSDKIGKLSAAYKELTDDSYITIGTINEIKTATGLSGDEWTDYETKLLNVKADSDEFNQVLSDLTYKIIENDISIGDLTNATDEEISAIEKKIEATLRENGVTNASAVAHDYVTRAKEAARIKSTILTGVTYDEIVALATEAQQAGIVGKTFNDLVIDIGILNNKTLDVSQKVSALQELGYFANWATQQLAGIAKVKSFNANGVSGVAAYDENGNLIGIDATDKVIPEFKPPVIPTYTPTSSSGSGGSGSSKDKKEYEDRREYSDLYDETLSQHEKEIEQIEKANEILQYKYEQALKNGDFELAEQIKQQINKNHEIIKDLRATMAAHLRELASKEITPEIIDIAARFGFDWSGRTIDEISDVEIEQVRQGLEDDVNRQKDIGVDMENAGQGDNAYNIKTAELELDKFNSLTSTATSFETAVGNANGEGEQGLKWLEEQEKILENNLKYTEAISDEYKKQSDNIEHQIELQRNAFNGDDVSFDFINSALEANAEKEKKAHEDAEAWRQYYRENSKLTDEEIEQTEEVQEAQKRWWEARQNSYDLYQEAIDKVTKAMDEQIERLEREYEQQNLIIDALEKKYDIQRQLREEQRDLTAEYEAARDIFAVSGDDGTLLNKKDYDRLTRELKSIDSEITSLYEDYRDAINALGEDEWYKQEEITNEFERQQEALLDQYELAKKQLEVTKQRTKLENTINNKNKRTLIGGKWVQTADLQAVYEERKNLLALEDEEYELKRQSSENKQLNAMRKLSDATNTEAKAVQNRIDMINDMNAQERKAFVQEILKVKDMDNILNSLDKTTLPKFKSVIEKFINALDNASEVKYSNDGSNVSVGSGGHSIHVTPSGGTDGSWNDNGFDIEWTDRYHTGRVRGLKPDEEEAILLKNETVLTNEQAKNVAAKLKSTDEILAEKGYTLVPSILDNIPEFKVDFSSLYQNMKLPTIPTTTTNNNDNSQVINIEQVVVKEPVQDINGLLRGVIQDAQLYHIRTKNIR